MNTLKLEDFPSHFNYDVGEYQEILLSNIWVTITMKAEGRPIVTASFL